VRIAFTHAFCWPEVRRGAERLVGELTRSLARLGHDVTLLSSGYTPRRGRADGVKEVVVRRRHDDVGAAERAFGRRVLPELLAQRFDVVHSHGRHDGVAAIRSSRVLRHRITVHTEIGIPSRSWWESQPNEAPAAERVIRDVDVYACLSRFALDVLDHDYGRRGVLIPGGVDLDRFIPAPARTPHPTILFSGAFAEPRKGVSTLLRALPIVAKDEPDVRLLLSGSGDAAPLLANVSPETRARVEVLGAGRIEDQPIRYGTAWACALPSTDDTFGLALVEALACGTPVVAGDHSALPELVKSDVTGALCQPGDASSVASACLRALELARAPGIADVCRESVRPYDWMTGVAPLCIAAYEEAR
jgi:phosphatidylinositol alpha-mannosyltransferase